MITVYDMIADGWTQWMYEHPPFGKLIQIHRPEWIDSPLCYREEMHPEANVYGLYWRLTGIGKESAE